MFEIQNYQVFWKDLENKDKGTVWLYTSGELKNFGQIEGDYDVPISRRGCKPSLVKARGKKWLAIYEDEAQYSFKASPMATKPIMAAIVKRWGNPPSKLKLENGSAFTVADLQQETYSYVYLVELLTFHRSEQGQAYYKIGKAKSIPKRIKQFGPCQLVESIKCSTEQVSYETELVLHQKFEQYCRPETEIFYLGLTELKLVQSAFQELR